MFYSFCRYNYEEEIFVAWEDLTDIVKNNPNNNSAWIIEEFKGKIVKEK